MSNITLLVFIIFSFQISLRANDYRIVSLSPNLTEIIYELGLEEYLVGTSTFSNYPESAKKVPQVGSYLQPQIEKIIRLKPTHVLVMKEGSPNIKEQLTRAKINHYVFESKKLSDYKTLVEGIANIFHKHEKSKILINSWQENLDKFKIFKPHNKKRSVLIQVDSDPIIIAGKDTFLNDVLDLCSLKNSFAHSGYTRIPTESIMNRKPDFVLIIDQMGTTKKYEDVRAFYLSNPALNSIKFLRGDSEKLARLTARFLPEAFNICSQAHQPTK